ncbi:hypothetical protein [Actinotalea fermentans]|uniref:Uncharacterized protein n=1 Tax=Actinotalea fermentans TaxID=43671 RepID=A0A511YX29_9CELL|nr:hypothetical protein [Actinotalea fermentans]GEN79748.1 hypothetical protein AFE02nite_14820 [Actinotalea fermentans]
MSQTAGVLLVAVAVLWIAYLVPHRLRYRQQLAECRTEDRFSERLRVVRVAGTEPGARRHVAANQGRVLLHPPRRGGGSVDRPHGLADRVVADAVRRTAAERAARAAYLARRRAGARRRAILATTLLVLAVAGWAGVVAGGLIALGLVPSALFVSVLGLGRQAVVAGRRADAAWAAGAAARAAVPRSTRPTAVGHAHRPSEASTEVIARVPAERAAEKAPVAEVATDVEETPTWAPVPVPRPTYSLKPAVRRPDPAPLVLDEQDVAEAAAAMGETGREETGREVAEEPAAVTAGFDLDAVLARRRASGE